MRNKVYDCFTFFNEDVLLKLRLETLWDYVDYFVICESSYTFSGKPKPINFNISKYQKYKSKIRYLLIDSGVKINKDPWVNEGFQRNYLLNGLTDAVGHDFVILSDIDEIPNPQAIKEFRSSFFPRAELIQNGYAYYMNNLHVKDGIAVPWNKVKITNFFWVKHLFKNMESLREYRPKGILRGLKRLFVNKLLTKKIQNGGWHFTWMGSIEEKLLKLESFSHQEFNIPKYKNKDQILVKIKSGNDLLDRDFKYELQSIDKQFPEYLVCNKDEFKDFILE